MAYHYNQWCAIHHSRPALLGLKFSHNMIGHFCHSVRISNRLAATFHVKQSAPVVRFH